MLNKHWEKEAQREKELEQQKLTLYKERNKEIINHNAMEKELRAKQAQDEKARDKLMIDQMLTRE